MRLSARWQAIQTPRSQVLASVSHNLRLGFYVVPESQLRRAIKRSGGALGGVAVLVLHDAGRRSLFGHSPPNQFQWSMNSVNHFLYRCAPIRLPLVMMLSVGGNLSPLRPFTWQARPFYRLALQTAI